jgi:7-cyano-7-deazaguanine synthase
VLAIAASSGQRLFALSFAYGQRHAVELGCARRQAARFGVERHEVVDLSHFGRLVAGATALVEQSELAVPKTSETRPSGPGEPGKIPVTYVPARNAVFLVYALAWAETLGAREIHIGVNAVDYSGYPDCRPAFLQAFETMAGLATRAGVEGSPIAVRAPLVELTKHEIIRTGIELGVDYADTVSCYDPEEREGRVLACGHCESCTLRRRGFHEARVDDPTLYR